MSKQKNRLLVSTRKKAVLEWQKYKTKKSKILSKKTLPPEFKRGLLEEERAKTKRNISTHFDEYRSIKYSRKHESDIKGLLITNKHVTANTIQKTYKTTKGIGERRLDKTVTNILNKDKVRGSLVTIKIKDKESGEIKYISDFITKGQMSRLKAKNKSVYEHVAGHARAMKSTHEFKELGIYIKVINDK